MPVLDLAAVGSRLAAVTSQGAVRLVEGGRPGRVVVPAARGATTWLSSDLAMTVRGSRMVVRRLPRGNVIASVPVPSGARFAAAGPGGRRFVVAGRRGATVIDSSGGLVATLAHPARVHRAAFSPFGTYVATAGADGNVMVWFSSGRLFRLLPGADDTRMFDVAFSPRSTFVAAASSDGTARTWTVKRGERYSIMPLHGNHVRRASFGPNEDSLLTASRDWTARTWKVETGGPRAVFLGHTDTVTAAVFAAGDMIATASRDGTVRTWAAQLQPHLLRSRSLTAPRPTIDPRATVDGANVSLRLEGRTVELVGHEDDVLSVEVSRDGSRVVTASEDGDARIWDARTGEPLHVLRGHGATVFDASFSPNGRWVVTAGPIAAGLWDARDGVRVYFLQGHEGGHLGAAEFRGSRRIVTSGADGVRSFDCDTCGGLAELRVLAAHRLAAANRRFTADERSRYLGG